MRVVGAGRVGVGERVLGQAARALLGQRRHLELRLLEGAAVVAVVAVGVEERAREAARRSSLKKVKNDVKSSKMEVCSLGLWNRFRV